MSNELVVKDNGISLRAELDTQIATANAYPRDEQTAINKAIWMATLDEETAQGCFYALPRKDKDGNKISIEGDSIRLAEIVRCAWKNLHTQTRIVEVAERYITTEAVCWDLQTNNKHIATDRISIWFGEDLKKGKLGYRANNDMQIMLAKASQAKALRNAIFQVVPKALVKMVSVATKKFSLGGSKTLIKKVTAVIDKLVKMGVDREKMMSYFGYDSLAKFTEEDCLTLIGLGTAIKEGHIKVEDSFNFSDDKQEMTANEKINDLIAKKKTNPVEDSSCPNYPKVKAQLLNAKSQDTLNLAADLIRECDSIHHEELRQIYNDRSNS